MKRDLHSGIGLDTIFGRVRMRSRPRYAAQFQLAVGDSRT